MSNTFGEYGLAKVWPTITSTHIKYFSYVPVAVHQMCSVTFLSPNHLQYPKQQLQVSLACFLSDRPA